MSTRRAVIGAAAGTAIAATGLAGCSTYGKKTSATPAAPTGSVRLGPTSDVPVGGGKIYTEEQVVVTQPAAGKFKCFTAVCTHQGCLVDDVSSGTINCPCHGSRYSIANGSVVQGPAPAALASKTINITGDTITLA
jgi:Rieske Fe-S protein